MERFVKGDVVIIHFPFSDLTGVEKRPALVLLDLGGEDILLCQITSNPYNDKQKMPIREEDFNKGKLKQNSFVRPLNLFTGDYSLIEYKAGSLKQEKINEVIERICELLRN
ncbi:MAG: type II toxin-antitoxin system PemK/MazF family toxin [Nanoarchaeota archaeon]|nr:type II toxin-antitoxin system PemK/MazF family toxin [Nanoarchaeota archaeon]MBU1103977.1 type II toxin-antitoxin system PemK/MazF family toxin [Nanoarchaeota archaeon]